MRRLRPLVLLALLAGCGTNAFEAEVRTEETAVALARQTIAGDYGLVTAEELKARLDAGEPLLLVDAMPREESYAKEHLPGALCFPFPVPEMQDWDVAAMNGEDTATYSAFLGEDRTRPIVVYCGFTRCTRSHNAALWARRLGYSNVLRFPGGLHAWKGLGHPLEP